MRISKGVNDLLYNLSYEITALVFLICIAAHFFSKKNYPSRLNRLFGVYLSCGMADVIFDIIGVFTITYAKSVPLAVNYAVNIIYYLLQMLMPYLLFAYVLMVTERTSALTKTQKYLMNAPLCVISVIIALTPITHMIFYFDGDLTYSYGKFSYLSYVFSTGYVIATDLTIILNRSKLTRNQLVTLLSFTLISVAGIVIQFMDKYMLVTGVSMSVCITLLYLTLQNPKNTTDDLTQLLDRHSFELHLKDQILSKSKKSYVILASVLDIRSLDLALGMRMTNELIVHMSNRVKLGAGINPCFRLSTDQFAVVCDSMENASHIASRLARAFNQTQKFNGYEIGTTGRVAYMTTPCQNYSLNELNHVVERMSEIARDIASDNETPVDADYVDRIRREDDIVTAMREALNNGGFEVYLQPMFSPEMGRFIEAEALLRFNHHSLGSISPEECIPLAERNGLLIELGELVLRRVCAYEREYHLSGLIDHISINVSEAEMLRENGADKVLGTLREFNVNPGFIRFELTETIATASYRGIKRNMRILHDNGVTFSLDDFGCGYANFDSVMLLPFDAVKLDKSMLNAATNFPRSLVVMRSIVNMLHAIGMKVVVEGAESIEQVRLLCDMGVNSIQGFFYTQAIPISQYVQFITESHNASDGKVVI